MQIGVFLIKKYWIFSDDVVYLLTISGKIIGKWGRKPRFFVKENEKMQSKHPLQDMLEPEINRLGFAVVRSLTIGQKTPTLQMMMERKDRTDIVVEDCATVSRAVSEILDEKDPIKDQYNLEEYNARYNLDLKPLPFASSQRAKEAFLLNRCTLLTGNALYLTNTLKSANIKDENTRVLPEVISVKPVYAFASKNNNALRISAKWILNALKLAEDIGINSSNIDIFIGVEDTSTKNLLGVNDALWNRFKVRDPQWVRKALKEIGNYGEIYEKNLGRESEFKLEREQNRLLKDGGLIIPQPFL